MSIAWEAGSYTLSMTKALYKRLNDEAKAGVNGNVPCVTISDKLMDDLIKHAEKSGFPDDPKHYVGITYRGIKLQRRQRWPKE